MKTIRETIKKKGGGGERIINNSIFANKYAKSW